ncbi:acyl-CoA thioesterase-1 [Pedobacter sp. AK013]|uniref:arylesterase n=1 Tax=Pedobacter sp. AK013 TaxID=2723071 RepID=UPI0016114B0B|nr:arylesterase [Pedobacter sp. AK013]MBB6235589.1 acyl-CoA thioesterase-1 [Pedobacter sp. AK013]
MLRKRLMGLFVLSLVLLSCGNQQSKSNTDKTLDSTDQKKVAVAVEQKNILFFGTSLTAGYGLDPTEAYPALIQNRIDSLQMPYKVINGGLSGETSAGGKGRIDWLLKQRVDIFVLELGANDGLRGLPVSQTVKNLQAIIDRVKAKYPDVKMVLAGMQVPPNMGAKYAADFKNMFPDLAKKNQMALIPFLLDKVGGVPKLNQADGIHPTAEGDRILAENVWVVLKDLL